MFVICCDVNRALNNMPLTDDQKGEVEELFMLYDTDNDSKLSADEFKSACRGFGMVAGYPTESQLNDYLGGSATMDKAKFTELMHKRYLEAIVTKDADFYFLTKGNPFSCLGDINYMNGKEFYRIMSRLGDKMSKEEYEKMWTDTGVANPGDGDFSADDLYAKLTDLVVKPAALPFAGTKNSWE